MSVRRRSAKFHATYVSDPTENIGMEADMVLRDVYATLNEDLTLQSTAIVLYNGE